MKRIFEGLNEAQKGAVVEINGPLLILAGAGSGKTKTLTHRIAYLISEKKIDPARILAVTFTNKAAREMRERIAKLMYGDRGDMNWEEIAFRRDWMPFTGTFHGICVKILRRDGEHLGIPKSFVIFDEQDRTGAVKQALREFGIDEKKYTPRAIAAVISSSKNELIDSGSFRNFASTPMQKVAASVFPVYEKILEEASALDFDDLILKTVRLLEIPDLREKWRNQFEYILVDEYQDTNSAQYKLVKLLVNSQRNICVIGDDWQNVYMWRGADFRNILNFETEYPDAKIVKLEQNYRSTKQILDAAQTIISKNRQRSDKKLWTKNNSGKPVCVQQVADERAEAEWIVSKTKAEISTGSRGYKDFTVLYRTNAQSRPIEDALVKYGIPYKIVGGQRFYDRKEIKDIIAYLRLIFQPEDKTSFNRIINVPSRKIGDTSLEKFFAWQEENSYKLSDALSNVRGANCLTARAVKSFVDFANLLEQMRTLASESSPSMLIDVLLKRIKYIEYLDDGSLKAEERIENVKELVSVAKEYDNVGLAGFLEEVALMSDVDNYQEGSDSLTLMTIHAAKGLEFPVVIMCGMEEGLFPHSQSMFEEDKMEEERRLCYVGMTRAKEELYLLHARSRMVFGSLSHNIPSRFLNEIGNFSTTDEPSLSDTTVLSSLDRQRQPETIQVEVKIGDRVRHKFFGEGIVSALDGDVADIVFAGRGSKKLNTAFAPLEKL